MDVKSRTEVEVVGAGEELRQVVGRYVRLRRSGEKYVGLCPFHDDTNPSLTLYPDGHFYCFGCEAHGDANGFVRRVEELDVAPPVVAAAVEDDGAPDPILEDAWQYYRGRAMPGEVREWWERRGIDVDAADAGYADGGLHEYLLAQAYSEEHLREAGLVRDDGNDLFVGCTVFPVLKENRVVDLVARADPGKGETRWLRRRGVQIKYMYNEDDLGNGAEVVVCEGITDALTLRQQGIPVVGLPAAWLKDEGMITRLRQCRTVYICLDTDETGREAAADLAGKLGEKARLVCLPSFEVEGERSKDVNDFFRAGKGVAEFRKVMGEAATGVGEFLLAWAVKHLSGTAQVTFIEEHVLPALAQEGRSRAYVWELLEQCGVKARKIDSYLKTYTKLESQYERQPVAIAAGETTREKAPEEFTDEELREAERFLESDDLMGELARDLDAIGIVGEKKAKLLIYLAFTSRKTDLPINLEVRGAAGVGKSYIVNKLLSLMPAEDVVRFTRITSHYLDYREEHGLENKILCVAEAAGTEEAAYSVRMLGDDTSPEVTLGYVGEDPDTKQKVSQVRQVRGPVAIVQTTTKLERDVQDESRALQVYLDESQAQREAVHAHVKRSETPAGMAERQVAEGIARKHRAAQSMLRPLPVCNPYAEYVDFPAQRPRSTRDLKRFLSIIRASAFLHQRQRHIKEVKGKESIVATLQDYEVAREIATGVMKDSLDELNPRSRELLRAAQEIQAEKDAEHGGGEYGRPRFTRRELAARLGCSRDQVARAIGSLEADYLDVKEEGKGYTYRLKEGVDVEEMEELELYSVEELREIIEEHPDDKDLKPYREFIGL